MNYKEIIQAIKNGRGAETLYDNYANQFYGYAIDKWHCKEDEAWDVVEKTLVKLQEKLPLCNFEKQNQYNAYLWKVFKSYLNKSYQKKKRKSKEIQFVSIEQTTEGFIKEDNLKSVGFDESFVQSFLDDTETDRVKLFKKALNQLADIDREILLLRIQNLTYSEIAGILGLDQKQLKVKHFRAKKRLISLFEKVQKSKIQL